VIGTFACRDLVELVTDYLEGALAPEVHAAVEEHLRGCDGCTAYVAQIQATVDALGETMAPPLDPQVVRPAGGGVPDMVRHARNTGGGTAPTAPTSSSSAMRASAWWRRSGRRSPR
jgi:anti-sigma factor RsiW